MLVSNCHAMHVMVALGAAVQFRLCLKGEQLRQYDAVLDHWRTASTSMATNPEHCPEEEVE